MCFKQARRAMGAALLCLPLYSIAGPFSAMYVFGDSLSDTGNTVDVFGVPRPAPFQGPYMGGRFSNGPLWTERLADGLGLSGQARSYAMGGNNYAFAGSETGGIPPSPYPPLPGLLVQTQALWAGTHAAADPNALYVVVAGGNDMRDARDYAFPTMSPNDMAGRQAVADNAIQNLKFTLAYLSSKGAKNVMVANLPDLGLAPEAIASGLEAASTDGTNRFNAEVPGLVAYGQALQLKMTLLDLYALMDAILTDPGAVGITNTTDPCAGFLLPNTGVNNVPAAYGTARCDASFFADTLHPTAKVHALMGVAALRALGVPEPSSLALVGVAALVWVAAKRRKQSLGVAPASEVLPT